MTAPARPSRPARVWAWLWRSSGTGDRTTRILGLLSLIAVGVTAYLGLVVSPNDVVQGDLVRLIYVHPAAATTCYVGFGLCALGSLAYLWPRTRSLRWIPSPPRRPRSAWCSV